MASRLGGAVDRIICIRLYWPCRRAVLLFEFVSAMEWFHHGLSLSLLLGGLFSAFGLPRPSRRCCWLASSGRADGWRLRLRGRLRGLADGLLLRLRGRLLVRADGQLLRLRGRLRGLADGLLLRLRGRLAWLGRGGETGRDGCR